MESRKTKRVKHLERTDGAGLGSVWSQRRMLLGWDALPVGTEVARLRSAVARWMAPRCAVLPCCRAAVALLCGLHMRVGSFWTSTEILLSHPEPGDRRQDTARCACSM